MYIASFCRGHDAGGGDGGPPGRLRGGAGRFIIAI